jgi:predicted transcriptional regulator
MKAILSIKPEFVEKIILGEKKFEFRRKIFKKDVTSVIVYASSPTKAVIGEFIIDDIINYELDMLWKLTNKEAGISKYFFYEYFKNMEKGYAIKIREFIKYNEPRDIKDYGLRYPPQSYVYL